MYKYSVKLVQKVQIENHNAKLNKKKPIIGKY